MTDGSGAGCELAGHLIGAGGRGSACWQDNRYSAVRALETEEPGAGGGGLAYVWGKGTGRLGVHLCASAIRAGTMALWD